MSESRSKSSAKAEPLDMQFNLSGFPRGSVSSEPLTREIINPDYPDTPRSQKATIDLSRQKLHF